MKVIAIRVDGSPNIGMGHIMRCLTLAKIFKKNDYKVYFISRYKLGIDRIKEEGFEVLKIKGDEEFSSNEFSCENFLILDEEVKQLIDIVKEYNIKKLIIDSYNVTEEYFFNIKEAVEKLIYIDDLNKFIYPVDVLLNGNITSEYMDYKKYSEDEIMLLGTNYNIIREEYRNLPDKEIRKEVKEIMITTGSSDPHNMTSKILHMIISDNQINTLTVNVVVGSGFNNKDELAEMSKKYENISLYYNPSKMSEIMLKSDVAISAGGSTLYELCACGTPTLAFIYVDNQEFLVKKMNELSYIKSLGWYDKLNSQILNNEIKKIIYNNKLRRDISKTQRNLINANNLGKLIVLI